MDTDHLVSTYPRALAHADAALAVSLFTNDAVVHSPLYGPTAPRDFYPMLFADTGASPLTLHGTMRGRDVHGIPLISFFFHAAHRAPILRKDRTIDL